MEAMIFAAGLGTRMKPLTDFLPKALMRVNGKTLLEIVIQKLTACGCRHIVINVHYFAEQIIDFIENHDFSADIFISHEKEELLDTGGGLKYARQYFSGRSPILIHNTDILSNFSLQDLYACCEKERPAALLAVSRRETSRYFLFDQDYLLRGWKNKKTDETRLLSENQDLEEFAFSGIQVVSPDIFDLLPDKKNFSITEAYLGIAGEHRIKAYIHEASDWLDVGNPETMLLAEKFLKTNGTI